MKCPRCDEYMEKKGENWICSSCGYSWSEHSLFPLVVVVIVVLVYLALQEVTVGDDIWDEIVAWETVIFIIFIIIIIARAV